MWGEIHRLIQGRKWDLLIQVSGEFELSGFYSNIFQSDALFLCSFQCLFAEVIFYNNDWVKEIPYGDRDTREEFHAAQRGSVSGLTPCFDLFLFSIIKLVKNHRAYYFSIIYHFIHVYLNKKKNQSFKEEKISFVVIINSLLSHHFSREAYPSRTADF